MVLKRCSKCGIMVKNLASHIRKKRCEAVEDRRAFRNEIKRAGGGSASIGIVQVLGPRGTRTMKRNGELTKK